MMKQSYRKGNRILSFVLVLAMVISMLPMTVSAVEIKTTKEEQWIDRIADLPDYAKNFYAWLVENSDGDRVDDALIDPTKGTLNDGDYIYIDTPAWVFTGTVNYEYTVANDATAEQIKTAAEEAAVDAVAKATQSIDLKGIQDYLTAVYQAFERDHPEVFWLSGKSLTGNSMGYSYSYNSNGSGSGSAKWEVQVYFFLRSDDFDIREKSYPDSKVIYDAIENRDSAVKTILSGIPEGSSRLEKVTYLNTWLTENNCYNSDVSKAGSDAHSCLSALTGNIGENGPVCEGYAKAFKVLCDKLEIPCVLVDGNAMNSADAAPEPHMWNYVQMEDGNWYAVDVTWNDPVVSGKESAEVSGAENTNYLLVGSNTKINEQTFAASHEMKNQVSNGGLAFTNEPVLSEAAYTVEHIDEDGDCTCDICKQESHNYTNGFCANTLSDSTVCGSYEPATLKDGVYQIGNAGQLYWFADKVNNDNTNYGNANAILTADITVNEGTITADSNNVRDWTPIGNSGIQYTGTFDGNNHTVSGMYYEGNSTNYVGMFGYVGKGGNVQNVGVVDSYFNTTDSVSRAVSRPQAYVGSVVGFNTGSVVGFNTGSVSNCYNTGKVTGNGSGDVYVGGVVGYNQGSVSNCSNTGEVTGNAKVGGVVGSHDGGSVSNCYYQSDSETDDINGTTAKTADQFKSGEVAWLLSQGCVVDGVTYSGEVWKQTIGKDASPNFTGMTVYNVKNCDSGDYSNSETGDHVWNNGVCNVCGEECEHETYSNGVCTVCGELAPLDFYGWSLTLQDNIALNYVVDAKFFADGCYTDPSVTFTMGNRTVTVSNYSTTKYNGYYTFTFTDIAPHQMGETVTAVLSAKNGEEMVTTERAEYSVKTYCTNKLDAADSSDKLKTLVVDLLNYGAATQTYVDSTGALVNANLTEEQKAFGTQDVPELKNNANASYKTVIDPSTTWVGAYLTLTDAVEMKFVFSATSIDGLTVKVTTADPSDSTATGQTWTISEFQTYNEGEYSGYVANFDGFNADQMREIVYVTVYDADGNAVSNTYRYSIESYAAAKANENGNLASLVKAMMKYGDSAQNFNS